MSKIEDAIERIKNLECPTGDEENRIEEILVDYGIANKNEIEIKKSETLNDGATEFCANISGNKNQSIIVLATSGMDDYVAKVKDVYLN
jgi:hypothetical protein